jgi:hypothetical protein
MDCIAKTHSMGKQTIDNHKLIKFNICLLSACSRILAMNKAFFSDQSISAVPKQLLCDGIAVQNTLYILIHYNNRRRNTLKNFLQKYLVFNGLR